MDTMTPTDLHPTLIQRGVCGQHAHVCACMCVYTQAEVCFNCLVSLLSNGLCAQGQANGAFT